MSTTTHSTAYPNTVLDTTTTSDHQTKPDALLKYTASVQKQQRCLHEIHCSYYAKGFQTLFDNSGLWLRFRNGFTDVLDTCILMAHICYNVLLLVLGLLENVALNREGW
mmetsp:Transcript_20200/g.30979  ORF Transcript_20200/g.30979 Transcript_20200/m.30979 type:complete len:109 (+) Transcript_20200:80-406(+)